MVESLGKLHRPTEVGGKRAEATRGSSLPRPSAQRHDLRLLIDPLAERAASKAALEPPVSLLRVRREEAPTPPLTPRRRGRQQNQNPLKTISKH